MAWVVGLIDHPDVVAFDDRGLGLVPCRVLDASVRDNEVWVYLSDSGYEVPECVVVFTTYRSPGRFWLRLADCAGYEPEEIRRFLNNEDKRSFCT